MGLCSGYVMRKLLFTVIYLDYFIVLAVPYINNTLDEDKVCGLNRVSKTLTVGKDDRSVLIIGQKRYFSEFSGEYQFQCSFVVKASFNQGIFAVIQKMKLRKNASSNSCIDYLQFCHFKSNSVEELTGINFIKCKFGRQYCGEVMLPSKFEETNKAYPYNPNAFEDEGGEIAVKIFISPKSLLPNESLDLVIAFTAYQRCARDLGSYKMCYRNANGSGINSGTCIYKEHFNDGVVNCPYIGCADECEGKDELSNMSTKVTMTAVTSIFLSFFLFLGCIWACRYFEMLCWSVQNIRRTPCSNQHDAEENVEDTFAPSAPSLTEHSPDKDLPPSYETLFPDS
ncbi:uncharacterized protein LOC142323786 [Lycorma delicatula]|uniref:uncharacterized protein LOC142323786 n=1 Tax=Lycorma delicatula TaxID=130591 RepID=UPI003F50E0A9